MLTVYMTNINSAVKKKYLLNLSLSKKIPGRFFQLNHDGFRYHFHFIIYYYLKFEAISL